MEVGMKNLYKITTYLIFICLILTIGSSHTNVFASVVASCGTLMGSKINSLEFTYPEGFHVPFYVNLELNQVCEEARAGYMTMADPPACIISF